MKFHGFLPHPPPPPPLGWLRNTDDGPNGTPSLANEPKNTVTVFIRIVAAATIIFSLAWVQLLIEGGSYLRTAFIYFRPILDSVVHEDCSTEDWFTKTALQEIDIDRQRSFYSAVEPSQGGRRLSSAMVFTERASAFHMRS